MHKSGDNILAGIQYNGMNKNDLCNMPRPSLRSLLDHCLQSKNGSKNESKNESKSESKNESKNTSQCVENVLKKAPGIILDVLLYMH